jgi:hypothetical protein
VVVLGRLAKRRSRRGEEAVSARLKEHLSVPEGFQGLIWAPSCEQEVVALFPLMLPYLGKPWAIEWVREGFPDCGVRERGNQGQVLIKTIEFKRDGADYFTTHAKKGSSCDVVVCWDTSAELGPGQPPEMIVLSTHPEVGKFVLCPEQSRTGQRVPKIADYLRACRQRNLQFEIELVEFLRQVARRFGRHTYLKADWGKNEEPCYTFVVRCPTANAIGAEAPGTIYVDWATNTSGVANVRPNLVEGYRKKVKSVLRNPDNREWGNIHLDRPEQLETVCHAVEWLVSETVKQFPEGEGA